MGEGGCTICLFVRFIGTKKQMIEKPKNYQQAESFFAQRLEKKNVICYNLTPRRKQGICMPYAIRQFQQNGVTAKTPNAETP